MSLNDIIDQVSHYAPNADLDVIMRAWAFAGKAHAGQLRRSGEPYLVHPIAVGGILAQLHMDVDTIATGLLHDTMEDCLVTQADLAVLFGEEVAEMVDGVTKIGKLKFRSKEEAQAENFRKMVLAMTKDVRVILVKLADRLHNMRTMEHMKPEKAQLISQETMDIYVPIANRLGLSALKGELEDLCFRYLHPDIYAELTRAWEETEPERDAYVTQTRDEIASLLTEHGLNAQVSGRPKHLLSIYKKMQARHMEFEQVHDLLAFRVIVDDIGACWAALGYIHQRWRHRPGYLKDYISQPKSNGYQSLHTVVLGPRGQDIEIQIRTAEMHRINEVGIAAHWRYKEGHLALSPEDIGKIARLRELWEAATDIDDPAEFLETVKVDLYQNEVYAFTPAGDVKFFPQGATVLDFAFAIHTEVGEQCTGAKVNGRMVPLRTPLKSSDTVEIITGKDQHPKREWLEWAHTGRALSKIRRHLREEERERGREMGRELLDQELRRYGTTLSKQAKAGALGEAAKKHGFKKSQHLYLAIGQGQLTPDRIVREMVPDLVEEQQGAEEPTGLVGQIMQRFRKRSQSPVLINGESDVMVSYARCCNPLPGEPVAGYITRGHGISVHAQNCPQLMAMEPERRVPVEWHGGNGSHTGEINVVCADKPGMLADIGAACKTGGINVTRMEAKPLGDDKSLLSLEVAVADVKQLKRLMRDLERIKGVITVDRVRT